MPITSMFHVVYAPSSNFATKPKVRGNGGKLGNPGHRIKTLKNNKSLTYGNGCRKWPDCFTCPFPPDTCYFDPSEMYSKKKKK